MRVWATRDPSFGFYSSVLTHLSSHVSSFCLFPLPWGSVLCLTCTMSLSATYRFQERLVET